MEKSGVLFLGNPDEMRISLFFSERRATAFLRGLHG
jgi:hypothetical protein